VILLETNTHLNGDQACSSLGSEQRFGPGNGPVPVTALVPVPAALPPVSARPPSLPAAAPRAEPSPSLRARDSGRGNPGKLGQHPVWIAASLRSSQ
jgi:hypothetical protein